MAQSYRVTRITEVPEFDFAGRVSQTMRIEFMVNTHGPFTHRIPKGDFNENRVRQDLDDWARRILAVEGA
jgi:hypothetical protein